MSVEILGGGIALAFIASLLACRALMRRGPIDAPSEERKAHRAPTPTSGGLGIAFGFVLGLGLVLGLAPETRGAMETILAIAGISVALLIVGFIDDTRHLAALVKFVLFAAFSVVGAMAAGVVDEVALSHNVTLGLPFAVGLGGSALWLFTLVNGVNFMDGANGLAMGSMTIGLIGLAVIGDTLAAPMVVTSAVCCVGALLGFLVWNFPSGRLFAGDSGALFVAALAGLLSLLLVDRAALSPFVPPILFFPLLGDVLLTLLWRAQRGRSLLVAHNEHLYQIALRAWPGHWRVAIAYWMAMVGCGWIAFEVALDPNSAAPWIALAGLAVLSVIVSAFMRSWAVSRGHLNA